MSEAILKKLEKGAVALVAVADQLSSPAVAATGQDRVHGLSLQDLRILVLVQQVFINEAMEVGVDLALARWNRGPKAEEFFTRMKDDVFDSWVDLRVSLVYAGTSWADHRRPAGSADTHADQEGAGQLRAAGECAEPARR